MVWYSNCDLNNRQFVHYFLARKVIETDIVCCWAGQSTDWRLNEWVANPLGPGQTSARISSRHLDNWWDLNTRLSKSLVQMFIIQIPTVAFDINASHCGKNAIPTSIWRKRLAKSHAATYPDEDFVVWVHFDFYRPFRLHQRHERSNRLFGTRLQPEEFLEIKKK